MSELSKQLREEYTWKDGHDDFVQPIIDPNVIALCNAHERLEAAIRGDQGEPRAILTVNVLRWPAEERLAFARHLLGSEWKAPEHERLEAEHERICNEHALLVQESGREGRELDRLEGLLRAWGIALEANDAHAQLDAVLAMSAEAIRLARTPA